MTDEAPNSNFNPQLRALIERVERLEEEKKATADDIRDVYAEAKANGFTPKIMRKLIAERKRDRDELAAEEDLLDLYRRAMS
jgi:uncharacterized protein (UPF0335 family)